MEIWIKIQLLLLYIKYLNEKEDLNSEWCQNDFFESQILKQKSCVFNVVHSLIQTLVFLEKNWGNDFNKWQYGTIHRHTFKHIPFSDVSFLSYMYSRSFPHSGNENTVNPSASRYGDSEPLNKFNGIVSGNLKTIFDLSDRQEDYWIIDTGNDESVFSKNYDNFIQQYLNGEYLKLNRNIDQYQYKITLTNKFKKEEI
ncbi:hypothetical protein PPERSA_01098 [Pseudocohnilembus persalinus]|uniref:Uncharacterized protein n=1 Tax=Pseudocohnilembus persalinus TaxID=266149 RepID=A0A0V0QUW8_PSEPJ|nr:hypothetical protein PPERSA_01098 [Pseudocohnilembus persalinus]|eukprot:KRX06020.1 hypothetical protein PPERSA_01098 [Pseudocohnilembus persalinus]